MLKSSLIEILKTFDKDELKRFEDFTLSPYFNKKTNITKIFRIINRYAPEFRDEHLQRKMLWEILFPGKDFNYGVMKNLIFDLQKLLTTFMGYEGIRKKDYLFRLSFLEELSEKNLDHQFEKNAKIYSDMLGRQKINDTFFYEFTKLEGLKYNNYIIKIAQPISENQSLVNFEKFLFLDFLRQYFILNINISLYKQDFKKNIAESKTIEINIEALFNNVLKVHLAADDQEIYRNIILMYYYGYKMTFTSDPEYYFKLKNLPDKYYNMLDMVEQYNIYNLLTGFCVNMSLSGDSSFYQEEFELYKVILAKEAYSFYKGGYMNRLTYYNIARAGIKLKEFEWTIDFLNEYKPSLPESLREQTYLFTYAFVEFGRKDYTKALELLSGLSHHEVRDKPREKMLYLMLYYELGYIEQLFTFVDSCRHFAKNDKLLSEQYNQKFLNFVNCLFNISKLKFDINMSGMDENISTLKQSVNQKDVSFRHWLLEKIDEIESQTNSEDL
ncbi:MAG: hypothetical protein ABIY50_08845 [Ignavibacteria bacterium]